ncbi:MAG: DUF3782 domain-containing protein [Candidatus Korarchaeota archaeon NZ13-K]|nr:MAG: DUF3782 domain-containing protein [Candidatus Korarchaeota archaeon NZ13-K]
MESLRLKRRMLRLLREDEEFRYAVAGLIGLDEILKRLDRHEEELVRLREDMNRLREDMMRGFERHDREIAELRREMTEGFKRHDEELIRLREDMMRGFELMRRHIDALGARWGLMAEEAFREGLRGVLERELGLRVERWSSHDEAGEVFGYPSEVEVDIVVKDGRLILVEVSSHVRASDVYILRRKADFYAGKTGRRPDRLMIVTPFIEERALEAARRLGVEVYTKV